MASDDIFRVSSRPRTTGSFRLGSPKKPRLPAAPIVRTYSDPHLFPSPSASPSKVLPAPSVNSPTRLGRLSAKTSTPVTGNANAPSNTGPTPFSPSQSTEKRPEKRPADEDHPIPSNEKHPRIQVSVASSLASDIRTNSDIKIRHRRSYFPTSFRSNRRSKPRS